MPLKKKNPPKVNDIDTSRAIQSIYDDINDIINSVNNMSSSKNVATTGGKLGDIRVVSDGNNYSIQGKTKEGWAKASLVLIDAKN
tara:strand:- start:293 stop:547 length:255 start_codon:yes stop_codon:yes gene_type:complete